MPKPKPATGKHAKQAAVNPRNSLAIKMEFMRSNGLRRAFDVAFTGVFLRSNAHKAAWSSSKDVCRVVFIRGELAC